MSVGCDEGTFRFPEECDEVAKSQPNFFLPKQDKVTARQLKKQHLRLVFLSRGVSFLLFYSPNKLHLHVQKLKYPRIRNEISMDT